MNCRKYVGYNRFDSMSQAGTNPIEVRVATIEDAEDIARVHVTASVVAYRPIVGPDYDGGGLERRQEQWRRILSRDPTLDPPAAERVLVACEDGAIVGLCAVGPSRDEDGGAAGEIFTLYVAPERWRSGVGKQLFDAGLDYLVERGFPEATLWVLEPNARARSFYEREGWRPDGARKPSFSRADLSQIRYRCSLT